MKKTIFVDMDGVLTDFSKEYMRMFGMTPQEVARDRVNKRFSDYWREFIDDRAFARLDKHEGADELIAFLDTCVGKHNVCILSSSGGFDRHRDVTKQKLEWLDDHFIEWPAMIVPGKRFKHGFASPDSILIDDTYEVVTAFEAAGGNIIHHTTDTLHTTVDRLQEWLAK
jgi:5'(3')-deoxyribonucleotidase